MGGSVSFHTALSERLSIIKCSREQVNKLLTDHPPQLTPGIRELVERLHQRGVKVFLISGGFRCIVEHVASQLHIPLDHVYANRLKFYFNGEYAGFDESQPTAQSGGKGAVIRGLKERYGFETVVMIGDGATDLEACPPAVSSRVRLTHTHTHTPNMPRRRSTITHIITVRSHRHRRERQSGRKSFIFIESRGAFRTARAAVISNDAVRRQPIGM
ncbi:phosphoserine phosphatase [Pimephales promelas]|nr:phosphoserine phosphatase [Pimephales promelas]KAG1948915.1 phosphoserine phosphatase [Pimephales promelas]